MEEYPNQSPELTHDVDFKKEVVSFIFDFDHTDERDRFKVAELIYSVPIMLMKKWCYESLLPILVKTLFELRKLKEEASKDQWQESDAMKRLHELHRTLLELKKHKSF